MNQSSIMNDINALYVAASPNSNQKAIQTLRDENVTYWGDDIIVL